MKNKFLMVAGIFLTSSLTGCGDAPKGPADTVREMYGKICDAKSIEPMLVYTAPQAQPLVAMGIQMQSDPKKGPKLKADLARDCEAGFEVTSEQIEGDSAVVKVQGKDSLDMIKIDDQWKIVINKN